MNGKYLLDMFVNPFETRSRGYKTFFMLNSVEHEILNAHKYINIKKFAIFLGSDKPRTLFFPHIHVKMPTIVGILTFMSRKNFILSLVEHEKSFITSGPDPSFGVLCRQCRPSSDAPEWGIWSGSTLFAYRNFCKISYSVELSTKKVL